MFVSVTPAPAPNPPEIHILNIDPEVLAGRPQGFLCRCQPRPSGSAAMHFINLGADLRLMAAHGANSSAQLGRSRHLSFVFGKRQVFNWDALMYGFGSYEAWDWRFARLFRGLNSCWFGPKVGT